MRETNRPFILRPNTSNGLIPNPGILFTSTAQICEFISLPQVRERFLPTFGECNSFLRYHFISLNSHDFLR